MIAGRSYGLEAIAGVTSGIIGFGEQVTWKTRQFGFRIRHTTEITAMNEPGYFQDSMVKGLFRSFRHDHFFRPLEMGKTEMRDEVSFSMPFTLGGAIAEMLFVQRRMSTLLRKRNEVIRLHAERSRIEAFQPATRSTL